MDERYRRKIIRRLERRRQLLELWTDALAEILTGGDQSYTIGGRQVNRRTYSADQCKKAIEDLEDEIDELEDMLDGVGPRIARRVIIRDI